MGLFRRRSEDALAKARREAGLEDDPEIGYAEPADAPPEPAWEAEPEPAQTASAEVTASGPARTIAEEIERASRGEDPKRPGRVGPSGPVRLPRR
jgi:hypothetical protein